jgi:hypothetical protein
LVAAVVYCAYPLPPDYFGTHNPFARLVGPNPTGVALAGALAAAARTAAFRQPGAEKRMNLETRLEHARRLDKGLTDILTREQSAEGGRLRGKTVAAGEAARGANGGDTSTLWKLYDSEETGRAVLQRLEDAARDATDAEISAAVDMIPCATLPDSPW